jgi:hypothetical protein
MFNPNNSTNQTIKYKYIKHLIFQTYDSQKVSSPAKCINKCVYFHKHSTEQKKVERRKENVVKEKYVTKKK